MLGHTLGGVADDMADAVSEPDVLIIGAGPAGLTAATYLGRFRRSVLVADGGPSRACWIPVSHNMPGFPKGITGEGILQRFREQALEYDAVIEAGRVTQLRREGDRLVASLNGREVRPRAVILATGVIDHHPDLPGVEEAVKRSLVRICPICDAYEAIGKAVAVIGDSDLGVREAAFMRTYSDRVTLIHIGPAKALTKRDALERMGIGLIEGAMDDVKLGDDQVTAVTWGDRVERFDMIYSALGTTSNIQLVEPLGVEIAGDDCLKADNHQLTSVRGLYAAGDVVLGLNQIATATSEAAKAATAIHNQLREEDGWTVE